MDDLVEPRVSGWLGWNGGVPAGGSGGLLRLSWSAGRTGPSSIWLNTVDMEVVAASLLCLKQSDGSTVVRIL